MLRTFVTALLMGTLATVPAEEAAMPGFRNVGFYLHACWTYKHPFAVRSWSRAEFAGMFSLLRAFGYDQVMLWPVVEALPMPLSPADAAELRTYRSTIDDARAAGLECWLAQCANLTSPPSLGDRPWMQRNFFPNQRNVRLDDPAQAEPYFAHRLAIMAILDNADAYVTIDGDPGGYLGADPRHFAEVFARDRAALAEIGARPGKQRAIPWIWCGFGNCNLWDDKVEPLLAAEIAALAALPADTEFLPGRHHRDGHGNGTIAIRLAEGAGLMPRSTIFCYESIEFEPSIPAAQLQFDLIRANLRAEGGRAAIARGVFGNAQQPVMVLPNLYFFARGARSPAYLERSDEQVLGDLAGALGGPAELLVPAWQCLRLELDALPADFATRLRAARLTGDVAQSIPGGAATYVALLADQVDSQRRLLVATATAPATAELAGGQLAEAAAACFAWWDRHGYVGAGGPGSGFGWGFVPAPQR
ncbi:MAG: hypothetical protein H0W72_18175, partial [Planctomycetes bacterium]|nr:hypothetical protein [Planctomycetota bacterium]